MNNEWLRPRRVRAFNLLEMLVVMLCIGVLVTGALAALQHQLPHLRLRQAATELSGFIQKARLRAIQSGHPVRITAEVIEDPASERIIASERFGDGTWREIASWTLPKPSGRPDAGVWLRSHQDWAQVGDLNAFGFGPALPPASNDDAPEPDDEAPPDARLDYLTYTPTGTTREVGTIRLRSISNTLEVAIDSYSGLPEVRKYLRVEDRPGGSQRAYWREGGFGSAIKWKWY